MNYLPMNPQQYGWIVVPGDCGNHVMPSDEAHTPDLNCKCGFHKDENVIVHHSFDGREDFENGKRKPS